MIMLADGEGQFGVRKILRSTSEGPVGGTSHYFRNLSVASEYSGNEEIVESLLCRALSIKKNYLGKPVFPFNTGPRQLYTYIVMLFEDVDIQERTRMEMEIEMRKKSTALLKVTVRESNISQSKHKNLSGVFCKLWTTPETVEYTTCRPNCDLLWWDEGFVLDIQDNEKDVLHIEMWSEISSGGFLNKFISQSKVSKDTKNGEKSVNPSEKYFVGQASVPIHNIPSDGGDVCVQLRKGHGYKVLGQIKVSFEFGAKPCNNHVSCFAMHLLLMKKCFEKQLCSMKDSTLWKNWLDVLPNPGLTLIHQHALQNGLNMAEQTLCSWLVISSLKMKNENRISYFFLHSLLDDVHIFMAEYPLSQNLENAFKSSKKKFFGYLSTLLKQFHRHFPTFENKLLNEINEMLRCLAEVDESKADSYSQSMKILEDESYTFYLSVIREHRAMLLDQNPVEEICDAIKQIMKRITIDQVTLDSVFSKAWFKNYTRITNKQLDLVLSSIIKPIIQHLSSKAQSTKNQKKRFEEGKKMLRVYLSIRDLVDYVICQLPEPRDRLSIELFSSWFGEEMIVEWFYMAADMSQDFIIKAVKADILEPVSSEIKYGTSVSDMIQVINQLVMKLWMKLEWEDQFYTHTALLQALKSCVITYVEAVVERMTENKKFACGRFQFIVTQRHCVILSNIFTVCEHLHVVEGEIKDIIKRAEEDFSIAILDPLDLDHSDLFCSVGDVFHSFFDKFSKHLSLLVKKIVRPKTGPTQEGPVYEMYKYVDVSLHTMFTNLPPHLYHLMLREMWAVSVNSLHSSFKQNEVVISGIYQELHLLQDLFLGDEFGLSWDEMQSRKYVELMQLLKSRKRPGVPHRK